MQSRDFCYWLQGLFELTDIDISKHGLTGEQVITIKKHLALVFKHEIDPSMGDQNLQDQLNAIHNFDPKTNLDKILIRC